MRAAMLGDYPTVSNLLSSGTPAGHASVQNNSGMTALMWASAEGHVEITKTLLSAQAPVNAINSNGFTALLYAFDNLPNLNPLPAPPPGFPGQSDRPTPPQIRKGLLPRVTGHGDVLKILLAAGADVNVKNNYGETVVHMAARRAQIEWVDVCLAVGVPVNAKSKGFEETALHVAAKEGHTDTVGLLCEKGATVDAQSRFGWTPLIWAAACGCEDVVKVLIEFGADVNVKAEGYQGAGTTALKEGWKSSKPQNIRRLLRNAGAKE